MNLREKLAAKIAEAKAALEDGDFDKGKALRAEAETIKSALLELEALNGITVPAEPEPMRPVLPAATPATQPAPENTAVKAAYTQQFGDVDSTTKAILVDLHGNDYEGKYWKQRAAFNRYLRGGDIALRPDEAKALRELVMTPNAVKAALMQGVDDIATFKSTMVEASDTLGGYLVPVDFQARIIERLRGLTVMRGRASTMTTSRDKVEIPVATGGDAQYTSAVRVTWVDETPTAGTAETNLTFGLEAIPVHTVMAETPLSRNMVEDSAFNIEAYLTGKFAEASAIDEDNRFLVGDGHGKPQGILPGATNALSLTAVNSGNASVLTWDGLIDVPFGVNSQYRGAGVWVGEKATFQAIRKMKDGDGKYLWEPDSKAGQPTILLGYQTMEQEAMPSIAGSAYPLIFGDMGGYLIVDRVGMTVERYLDSATARSNLIYYIMRRRLGGQVVESWRFAVQYVSA